MALTIKLETSFGERRELYVRINNYDHLTNHGEGGPDVVRFRGYLSRAAFEQRKAFVWELQLECAIDVSLAPHAQAYAALKAHDPVSAIGPPPEAPQALAPDADEEERKTHAALTSVYVALLAEHEAQISAACALRDALHQARDA